MKKILISFTIIFSMMFTSVSFAEWTKVVTAANGSEVYIDFDRIRKNDGFIYYWELDNYMEPDTNSHFSVESYNKGDCNAFRVQSLMLKSYEKPMGKGNANDPFDPKDGWVYPSPNSVLEEILNLVCK